MKKTFIYLLIAIAINTFSLQAQNIKEGFTIQKSENRYNGKFDTYYLDSHENKRYNAPENKNGQRLVVLSESTFCSIEKLNQIEMQIFNREEIENLSKEMCMAFCIVSSAGEIISVSFTFRGFEPNISAQKLAEYAKSIKKEITFRLIFEQEVAKEGYISQSFPVFKSLNRPK